MTKSSLLKLALCIGGSQATGFIGSLFTVTGVNSWYRMLERPVLAPPNWVFGPVWTTLYTLMGISAFLVWEKGITRPGVKVALAVFVLQLGINALWSLLFFGLESIGLALIGIFVLLGMIVVTMLLFSRHSRLAAVLLIPYLLWVLFATYLTYSFWVLN